MSVYFFQYPFIKNELFERILREDESDPTIKLAHYTLEPAVGKGENYASVILRVTVNYMSFTDESDSMMRTRKFIMKVNLPKSEVLDKMEEFNVFQREIIQFRDNLPKVQKIFEKYGETVKLAPMLVKFNKSVSNCDILILSFNFSADVTK